MIDVMKRLAELDAKNPNMVPEGAAKDVIQDHESNDQAMFESKTLAECGMSPMPGFAGSGSPANISITAGSGNELSSMLKDIMSLAGIQKAEPMGADHSVDVLTVEPTGPAEPMMGTDSSDGEIMRGVLDRLNPEVGDDEGEEETDEDYDNTPADPRKPPAFAANRFAHQENQPGQGDRLDGTEPKAYADMNETTSQLFSDYQKFINENWEAEKEPKEPTAAEKKESDKLKKSSGDTNKKALSKISNAFAKKKAD